MAQLQALLAQPLYTDRRKFLPVAAKLSELAALAASSAASQVTNTTTTGTVSNNSKRRRVLPIA